MDGEGDAPLGCQVAEGPATALLPREPVDEGQFVCPVAAFDDTVEERSVVPIGGEA